MHSLARVAVFTVFAVGRAVGLRDDRSTECGEFYIQKIRVPYTAMWRIAFLFLHHDHTGSSSPGSSPVLNVSLETPAISPSNKPAAFRYLLIKRRPIEEHQSSPQHLPNQKRQPVERKPRQPVERKPRQPLERKPRLPGQSITDSPSTESGQHSRRPLLPVGGYSKRRKRKPWEYRQSYIPTLDPIAETKPPDLIAPRDWMDTSYPRSNYVPRNSVDDGRINNVDEMLRSILKVLKAQVKLMTERGFANNLHGFAEVNMGSGSTGSAGSKQSWAMYWELKTPEAVFWGPTYHMKPTMRAPKLGRIGPEYMLAWIQHGAKPRGMEAAQPSVLSTPVGVNISLTLGKDFELDDGTLASATLWGLNSMEQWLEWRSGLLKDPDSSEENPRNYYGSLAFSTQPFLASGEPLPGFEYSFSFELIRGDKAAKRRRALVDGGNGGNLAPEGKALEEAVEAEKFRVRKLTAPKRPMVVS